MFDEHSQEPETPPRRENGDGPPNGVVALLVVVVLVAAGYFLVVKLTEVSRIQDCAMSGRTNCAPITP